MQRVLNQREMSICQRGDRTDSCTRHAPRGPIPDQLVHSAGPFPKDDGRGECVARDCIISNQIHLFGEKRCWSTELKRKLNHHEYLPVNGIVLPATALLHTNATPLGLRQETTLGKCLGKLLWQDDMAVTTSSGRSKSVQRRNSLVS
jgi:hypothetical protein